MKKTQKPKVYPERVQRVVVAMSGGVDSSVAAALLKRRGFDVVGVFMKFWTEPEKNGLVGVFNKCCSPEAEKRARAVARILGIPFYILNFEKEFKKKIVDYFLKEYKKGRTPNPCVVCNKEIKFGLLLKKALALGADFVAAGHYARIQKKFVNSKQIRYSLISAKDREKDQGYFLWKLNQNQLKHILFPIGDYTKTEVRRLAKEFNLPVLDIPESMEICFIKTNVNDFLTRHLKLKPGKIADRKGKIIGKHRGLAFYTIGQRKGIELPHGPYYVLNKDNKKNLLIVTKNLKDLCKKELICKNVHWVSGKEPKLPLRIQAKIRYRHQPASAIITKESKDSSYKLIFDKPERAITPGQSAVFHKNEELLGGGIIEAKKSGLALP